jgi:hypothetical protein
MQTEAMQHTENRKSMEVSTGFAGQIGQYIRRVYTNMAIELFQKPKADAEKDGFALGDADFAGYNPSSFSRSTERAWIRPGRSRPEDRGRYAEGMFKGIPATIIKNYLAQYYDARPETGRGLRRHAILGRTRGRGHSSTASMYRRPAAPSGSRHCSFL